MRSKINLESDKKLPVHICENKHIQDSGKMNVKLCPSQQDTEVKPRNMLRSSMSGDFPTYSTKKHPSYKDGHGLFAHSVA